MILVIDTETTGYDIPPGEVIELAAVPVYQDGNDSWSTKGWGGLIRPTGPIPPETSAVHHLTAASFDDVGAYPALSGAWAAMMDAATGGVTPEAYVAHNAEFDQKFLASVATPDVPWLCTYRLALHLYPDSPGYGNQTLRYFLELKPKLPPGLFPHRALYDAVVTAALLSKMLEENALDDLLILQTEPVLLKKIRFGKHSGEPWAAVPRDYLRWVLRQDFDKDIIHTAEHWLRQP